MPEIHARTEWCPFCDPPQKLERKNIDTVRAIKGCKNCKRKFEFIRTDTPDGRRARTARWRASKQETQGYDSGGAGSGTDIAGSPLVIKRAPGKEVKK